MKDYIKPKLYIINVVIKDKILSPSSNDVLNENNIVDDDPSYGWGQLF